METLWICVIFSETTLIQLVKFVEMETGLHEKHRLKIPVSKWDLIILEAGHGLVNFAASMVSILKRPKSQPGGFWSLKPYPVL